MNLTGSDWENSTRGNSIGFQDDHINSTSALEDYVRSEVPQWIAIVYFVIIFAGTCVNLIVTAGLLRSKRKGALFLILQLSITDLISTFVAVLEILSLRKDTWMFSTQLCPIFSGSEILSNCLTLYLLICLNFHVVSVWNLRVYQANETSKNVLASCNEDESNECLVKTSDSPSSSRTVTIDYRRRKKEASVIFPSLLVWFICLSLSIPEYTLSSTIKVKNPHFNSTVCAIIDTYYGQLSQNLLLVFRAIIPFPLIIVSCFILLIKIYRSRKSCTDESTPSEEVANAHTLIKFCIVLSALYLLTSLPKNILYAMHTYTVKIAGGNLENFKIPPLHNVYVSSYVAGFISMLNYGGVLCRSFAYVLCLPEFKALLKNNVCLCIKKS